jgi:hypothetical protein
MPSSQSSAPRPSPIAFLLQAFMLSITIFGKRPFGSWFLADDPALPTAQGAKIEPG